MQSKHKIVLAISQKLNVPLDGVQKYVQWYKIERAINYDFVNGHSFELENDIKTFIKKDYLIKKQYVFDLGIQDKFAIQDLKNKVEKDEKFTTLPMEFQAKRDENTLFTIGYEGISIDTYINKLLQNHIKTLVDVRKNSYSNKFGFSKKEFVYCLEKSNIKYIHIPELGIESEKRQGLKTAKSSSSSDYDLFGNGVKNIENKLFEDYKNNLPSKQKYIDKLLEILAQDKLIAITCFEADHKCCHRHVLASSLFDDSLPATASHMTESLSGVEVVNL
jgi:hypothetical protein